MKGYGSYCPIAKAAEILTERWTLLLIRDLLLGARHFNDFRVSIPLIPPATLSKRLKSLQDAGVIERVGSSDRGSWEYRLTESGMGLKPFLDFAGQWSPALGPKPAAAARAASEYANVGYPPVHQNRTSSEAAGCDLFRISGTPPHEEVVAGHRP